MEILKLFLVLVIVFSLIISEFQCMKWKNMLNKSSEVLKSSKNITPFSSAKNRIPKFLDDSKMKNTASLKISTNLFRKYGVGLDQASKQGRLLRYFTSLVSSKRHVCQPLYKNSNQIRGKPLCKPAVDRIYPQKEKELSTEKPIECIQTSLVRSLRNAAKDKHGAPVTTEAVVKCLLTDGGYFYVANTSVKDFYYAIAEKKGDLGNGTILGCFEYDSVARHDYKHVEIVETDNAWQADDIFGVYGTIQRKGKNDPNKVMNIPPATACRNAMKVTYISTKFENLVTTGIVTSDKKITRRILNPKTGKRIVTGTYVVLCCPATRTKGDKQSHFYLIRGPKNHLGYVLVPRTIDHDLWWYLDALIRIA